MKNVVIAAAMLVVGSALTVNLASAQPGHRILASSVTEELVRHSEMVVRVGSSRRRTAMARSRSGGSKLLGRKIKISPDSLRNKEFSLTPDRTPSQQPSPTAGAPRRFQRQHRATTKRDHA